MGVFSENALGFFNAGLMPLPIRADHKKRPAVKGHHGYEGKPPTREDIIQWILEFPDCNIAIRLPPFIVGIDIDAYEGKRVQKLWKSLKKNSESSLPPLELLPEKTISLEFVYTGFPPNTRVIVSSEQSQITLIYFTGETAMP